MSRAARRDAAYTAYGGVCITPSLLWLWAMERLRPDRWGLVGTTISLAGGGIILFGPRST